MTLRTNLVVIEAEQFSNPKAWNEELYWLNQGVEWLRERKGFFIHTRHGIQEVRNGDWIITDADGYKYPCKPEVFERLP